MGQVIVTPENISGVLAILAKETVLVFDTETTGLRPYLGSRMFSLAVATESDEYYFNFNKETEVELRDTILSPEEIYPLFSDCGRSPRKWIGQNIKFDMHMLNVGGGPVLGIVSDTKVLGRIKAAHEWKFSLNDLADRHLGEAKDDSVMNWLNDNKAFTVESIPDKGGLVNNYHFDFAPFPLISKYAMKDARLTYDLYTYFQKEIDPRCHKVVELEEELIPVLFDMEKTGLLLNRKYIDAAVSFEAAQVESYRHKFRDLSGEALIDSAEGLSPIFEKLGYILPKTEKGGKSVTDEVLSSIDHELAKIVQGYREHSKLLNTYFLSFIYYADSLNQIHTSFDQAGTNTGRISCREPNLQNIPKTETGEFPVRRAFVPRAGFFFVSIDYKQMEFRLMLDYANESALIEKINNGHDPHDATAEETGLDRSAAKTLNFGILYGMGLERLGNAIGVSKDMASQFKRKYFLGLTRVKKFLDAVKWKWEDTGVIYNWLGRRYDLDDKRWSYKGPNKLIQGGCADIVKIAMVELYAYLNAYKSRMVLQVHDEVLFEVHESEIHLVNELKTIMEKAYPHKNIPLTCSVAFSLQSFGDMVEIENMDCFEETVRKALSSKGNTGA